MTKAFPRGNNETYPSHDTTVLADSVSERLGMNGEAIQLEAVKDAVNDIDVIESLVGSDSRDAAVGDFVTASNQFDGKAAVHSDIVGFEDIQAHPEDELTARVLHTESASHPDYFRAALTAESDVRGEDVVREILDTIDSSIDHEDMQESPDLPFGNELRNAIADRLPSKVRKAETHDEARTVTLFDIEPDTFDVDDPANLERIQTMYIDKVARSVWWKEFKDSDLIASPDGVNRMKIHKRHTLEASHKGDALGQKIDVYEVGESQAEPDQMKVIFETLELIDQYTGGFMTDDTRVIVTSGYESKKSKSGASVLGYNNEDYTVINLDAVKERAARLKMDEQKMLSTVLIHELLGHGLERKMEGQTGGYFKEHFDYSVETVPTDKGLFEVHDSVIAKDLTKNNSVPMREYGKTNSSEDFAVSVEVSLGDDSSRVVGLDEVTVDEYRRELVLEMMQRAAESAKNKGGTPGYVGTEIEYRADQNGEMKIVPLRKLAVETIEGKDAVKDEIRKACEQFDQDEIVVYVHPLLM